MIVERLLGKDINSIEESDLNNLIGIPETHNIEFKMITDINPDSKPWEQKKSREEHKENIIKSVVGFLNANDNGLLILGVKTEDEVADRITGVGKDVLKQLNNEISLEDFLKEKVRAIPSFLNQFELQTKIVEWNDRKVIFIEVLNKNWERIFYSEISQYVYVRKGKSTESLSFPDTLTLVAERSYPQVYVEFLAIGENEDRSRGRISPNFRINYVNKGVKAAHKVHCFVLVGSDNEIEVKQVGGRDESIRRLDSNIYNLTDFFEDNQVINVFQFIYPGDRMVIDRIYPFSKSGSGYISIFEGDIDKINRVVCLTIEDTGFVKQEFAVATRDDKKYLEEINSEFSPYLTP